MAVEVASSFSALAGGTPAVLATRVRFFQQQGYDASIALSSAAIMTTTSWIVIVVLFACSLPFAWGSIHLKATPQAGLDPKLVWIALAVVVVVAVAAGLALAVPRLRRLASGKVLPRVRQVWGNLKQVAVSPRKLVEVEMVISCKLTFDANRWVAAIAVVNGRSETNSSSIRFSRMRSASAALMNRVRLLCAIHTPPMKAKLTK